LCKSIDFLTNQKSRKVLQKHQQECSLAEPWSVISQGSAVTASLIFTITVFFIRLSLMKENIQSVKPWYLIIHSSKT
jgi:hypothetical protein